MEAKNTKAHQKELDELKSKDPEFFQFLQDEDSSLLKFDIGEMNLSDESDLSEIDDSDPDEEMESDQDNDEDYDFEAQEEEESPQKTVQHTKVTVDMVKQWKEKLSSSEVTFKDTFNLISAFQAAVKDIDETKENEKSKKKKSPKPSKFKVAEADVFNAIIGACIECFPAALNTCLDYKPEKKATNKKKKYRLPSSSSHWSKSRSQIRLYFISAVRLIELLIEASVKRIFLRHLMTLCPYFVSFPKITKALLKVLVRFWSTEDNEANRVLSFVFIARIVRYDKTYLENTIRRCYVSYVSNCKFTTPTSLPMINFMQQSFTEICSMDSELTYHFAFVYIRNLAIHLRNATLKRSTDNRQHVCNWQFVHSIALWCRVLASLHPNPILQPLLYPIIQVSIGTMDLFTSRKYLPMRFRIVGNLISLSDSTDTFIPLLHYLIEPLQLKIMKDRPKEKFAKPASLETMLKFSNFQLQSRAFIDATIDKIFELLMEYVNSQAHTIAFPELILPAVVSIKRQIKQSNIVAVNKTMAQLCKNIKENSTFIKEKREAATFEVTDIKAVVDWEKSIRIEGVPFLEHYKQYRMKRDRELMGEIAARRTVVHERMPTVDREKFKRRFKEEDKEEFDTLFDMPDEEDVKESFQKIIDEGGFRMKKPKRKAFIKNDPLDMEVDDDDEEEDEKTKVVIKKKVNKQRKKKTPIKIGLTSNDKRDVVKDLCLDDI